MPAHEGDVAGCGAPDGQTNNAAYCKASGLASIKHEDGAPHARGQSLSYPPIPQARFKSFSGHEPYNLHHNITETARNALPPPFKNGFYLSQTSGPPNLIEVEDPGLRLVPRQPSHVEACLIGAGPRYVQPSEANLDQQRRGLWPCGTDDRTTVQDTAGESRDMQWETAERTWTPAAGVRLEDPAGSGYPLLEMIEPPDCGIFAKNWQTTWEPVRKASPNTTRERPSISSEEGEPQPKRRRTTNTESPSHPPADAVYQPGTDLVPPEILSIVAHIKSLPRKRGDRGYPMPTKLRSVRGMNRRIGFISKSSPLMSWYGDTRLFTAKWWMWLYVGGKARKELERELGQSDEVERRSEGLDGVQ